MLTKSKDVPINFIVCVGAKMDISVFTQISKDAKKLIREVVVATS